MSERTRREFLVQSAGALGVMALVPDLSEAARPAWAEPLVVGLVGVGRQGRAITAELERLEGVRVAGFCDTEQARRDWGPRRIEGARAFADHRAMLDAIKDLNAVVVATPTHLHKPIALDALAAGKHVYCEAPLAHTIEDCRAIAAAARGASRTFAVGCEGRSNPVYRLARTFFVSDVGRRPIGVEAQAFQKTSWRFPAADPAREKELNWRLDPAVSLGLAGEMGVQAFDVANWYLDRHPVSVRGAGSIRLHDDGREVPDTISCELEYPGGLRLTYNASLGNSYGGRYELFRTADAAIKLAWSHGWMFKEADAPTQGWEVYANRQQFHNDEGITLIADATKLAEQGKLKEGVGLPHSPLHYALADFVRAASEGQPPACDAAAGARSTIVSILAARAIATGERVAIDESTLKV